MEISRLVVGTLSLAASVSLMAATPGALPVELKTAVEAYDVAQINGDRDALTKLLADDYLLVNGGGTVETKEEFIAESINTEFKLAPFVVLHPANRAWSSGAVVSGEVYLTGRSDGKSFSAHIRFADVWAKRSGKWQVVFTQVTRIPTTASDNK